MLISTHMNKAVIDSLLLRRFVFRMAEASAKRVTGDEPQGTMVYSSEGYLKKLSASGNQYLNLCSRRLEFIWGQERTCPRRVPSSFSQPYDSQAPATLLLRRAGHQYLKFSCTEPWVCWGIRTPKSGRFLLVNPESGKFFLLEFATLGFGIRDTARGTWKWHSAHGKD